MWFNLSATCTDKICLWLTRVFQCMLPLLGSKWMNLKFRTHVMRDQEWYCVSNCQKWKRWGERSDTYPSCKLDKIAKRIHTKCFMEHHAICEQVVTLSMCLHIFFFCKCNHSWRAWTEEYEFHWYHQDCSALISIDLFLSDFVFLERQLEVPHHTQHRQNCSMISLAWIDRDCCYFIGNMEGAEQNEPL